MPVSVVCRGCGRRVRVPDRLDPAKARCPKCRPRLEPPVADYESGEHPRDSSRKPAELPLSLDDAEQLPDRKPPAPRPGLAKNRPTDPAPLPPPFRFRARVLADSRDLLRGTFAAVLTPHGFFLEAAPNQPFLFAPVGTPAVPGARDELTLTLPDRVLLLRLGGVGDPARLAADTVAFLGRARPVPDPADYRRPLWLLVVAAVFALALAAGPVVLSQTADLGLGFGLLLGAAFAVLGLLANSAVVLLTRLPVGGKVAVMAGVGVAVTGVFVFGATAYLAGRTHRVDQAGTTDPRGADAPRPPDPPTPTPGALPPDPLEKGPPTHLLLAQKHGVSRLDDGPADVTALAVTAKDGVAVIGYADGSTRVWPLDQPVFEPPRAGPKADGPVLRVQLDPAGTTAFLTCPGGLVVGPRDNPPKLPLKVPGEPIAVLPEPGGEKFAAVRAGKVAVRYVPTNLLRNPPAKGSGAFVVPAPKQEPLPLGVKVDYNLPNPKLTFLAWQPGGRLLGGSPDGVIVTWAVAGPGFTTVTKDHKAAVRAWAASDGGDFATGDDAGSVGHWPAKATTPTVFPVGKAALTHLGFSPSGKLLAVADADGGVSVVALEDRKPAFTLKRPAAVKAVAFSPADDILLLADGKGVEVRGIAAPLKKAEKERAGKEP